MLTDQPKLSKSWEARRSLKIPESGWGAEIKGSRDQKVSLYSSTHGAKRLTEREVAVSNHM